MERFAVLLPMGLGEEKQNDISAVECRLVIGCDYLCDTYDEIGFAAGAMSYVSIFELLVDAIEETSLFVTAIVGMRH